MRQSLIAKCIAWSRIVIVPRAMRMRIRIGHTREALFLTGRMLMLTLCACRFSTPRSWACIEAPSCQLQLVAVSLNSLCINIA
jgi:hypothetical protein